MRCPKKYRLFSTEFFFSFSKHMGKCQNDWQTVACVDSLIAFNEVNRLKVCKLLLVLNKKYFLKKGVRRSLFMTIRQGVGQVIYLSCCCWSVQNFCCTQIVTMGAIWMMSCQRPSTVLRFESCNCLVILKTPKYCAQVAPKQATEI